MSYRELFRHAPPSFALLALIARLPATMTPVAVLLVVQAVTGSLPLAATAAAAASLAVAVGGLATGVLADRYGPRLPGVLTAVACAVATSGLLAALRGSAAGMVLAAGAVGLTQPQIGALVRLNWSVVLRRRGRPELVPLALAYEAAADETGYVFGPALAGLLAAVAVPAGPVLPLVVMIVLLLGAALPLALRCVGGPAGGDRQRAVRPDGRHAGAARWRPIAVPAAGMMLMGVIFGALQTGVVGRVGAAAPATAGVLYAELGLGSAVAGLLYGRFAGHGAAAAADRILVRLSATAIALLTGCALLAVSGTVQALAVTMPLAGFTVAPFMIVLYAVTERMAPAGRLGAAIGVLTAAGPVGVAAGQVGGGWLADSAGAGAAFLLAVAAAGAAVVLVSAAAAEALIAARPAVHHPVEKPADPPCPTDRETPSVLGSRA